jgi:hypothetical protein
MSSDSHIQSSFVNDEGQPIVVRTSQSGPGTIEVKIEAPVSRQLWMLSVDEAREVSRQLSHIIRYMPKKLGKKKAAKGCDEDE